MTYADYTPTQAGFSSNMSGVTARYATRNKMMHLYFYATGNGTSNATTLTLTLPTGVNAKNTTSFPLAQALDAGAAAADAMGVTTAGSNVLTFYKTSQAGAWTNSGNKRVSFSVVIEIE